MAFAWGTRFLATVEVSCALSGTTALVLATRSEDARPPMTYEQQLLAIERSQLSWLGPRSESTEARVRIVLDKAFETSPGVIAPYRLTCDVDDCSLIVDERIVNSSWLVRFQEHVSLAGIADSMFIGSSHAFFSVPESGVSAGYKWMRDVDWAFANSGAVGDCKQRFPEPGYVTLTLHPNLASRSAPFSVDGPLATGAVANCVSDALRAVLHETPMPPAMTCVWKDVELSVRIP
jgi:hypothetical protein